MSSFVRWTDYMDEVMLNTLHEQHQLGNYEGNWWKSCAFVAVQRDIWTENGVRAPLMQIQNRFRTWKRMMGDVDQLLSMSGFVWDDHNKAVFAAKELWTTLSEDPNTMRLKSYEGFHLPFYHLINELFRNRHVESHGAEIQHEQHDEIDNDIDEEIPYHG